MVGLLTFGNRKFEALDSTMRAAIEPLHSAMQEMIPLVDKDALAFTDYMASPLCILTYNEPLMWLLMSRPHYNCLKPL